ncbi:hypothetical protein BN439_3561 [Erwinia amylovora Ea644]|nr:hypothetical protein BN439_3561 [Erwinia amylovora Ea644]
MGINLARCAHAGISGHDLRSERATWLFLPVPG